MSAVSATLPLAKDVTVAQLNAMLTEAGEELDLSMRRPALLEKARELKLIAPRAPDMEEPACSSDQVCIPLRDKDSVIVNWAIIDAADKEQVEALSWWILKINKKLYAQSQKGLMHILLMGEAPPGLVIDHKNGAGLLNTRANLRFATRGLNSQNKVKKQGTTSVYVGVSSSKWGWVARHGKESLGYFENEKAAAFAYDEKIREVHGEFGKVNGVEKPNDYKPYTAKAASGLPEGVRRDKKRFAAQYWDQDLKKNITLGRFLTEADAHQAYKQHKEGKEAEREARHLAMPILRNDAGVAVIPVKKGKEVVYALVDDADWHEVMKVEWHIDDAGYVAALRVRLHKVVLEGDLIDHRNGKLDNRRCSLAINTHSGNAHNKVCKSASGFSGVRLVVTQNTNKFTARIRGDKKQLHLGSYDTAETAAYAYDCAAKMLYGHLARLNGVAKPEGYDLNQESLRLIKTEIPRTSHQGVQQKFIGVANLTTKTQGVSFQARITWKGKSKNLGTYKSAQVAAYARDCAARMTGSEFVQMNNVCKPESWEWDGNKMRMVETEQN